jgi:hypothetical protein
LGSMPPEGNLTERSTTEIVVISVFRPTKTDVLRFLLKRIIEPGW